MFALPVPHQEKSFNQHEFPIAHASTSIFIHPLVNQATKDDVLVDFDGGDDPYRPMNWPSRKKVVTTLLYGFTTCWITFASAIYSAVVGQISEQFRVGWEVATLGTSLFVIGFALGPLLFGPLSEIYGRKLAVLSAGVNYQTPALALTGSALLCGRRLLFCYWRRSGYSDCPSNAILCRTLW